VLGAVQVWRFLALYTCTTLLGGVAFYLFVLALHPADLSVLPVIAAAVPVGGVVAAVTFVLPAGLGSRDITLAAVLATVLPAGVAVAAAAGFRVLQLAVELAWAAAAVATARRSETYRCTLTGPDAVPPL
jgi:glycosyltransferase 2 family protein